MSKKVPKTLTYKNATKLPKLAPLQNEWDLRKYFYKSEDDPKIEKDLAATERAYAQFEKKYKQTAWAASVKKLQEALTDYEQLSSDPRRSMPAYYFHYRLALNSADSVAEKKLNLISERLTKASNRILFFQLTLGKIPKEKQKAYLTDPALSHFHYFLKRIFLEAKHDLSEKEEQLLNLLSGPASGMWVDGTEKILGKRTVTFEKKTIALPEAIEMIDALPSQKKQKLWSLILDQLQGIGEIAENEFNAIITTKKITDEMRGYTKPYSATVLGYENDEKSVENLIETITDRGFALSRKFYALKAKFHGVKSLPYVNKYDSIGADLTIPYRQAVEIARDAFYGTKNEYGAFFDSMVSGGNVDVFSKRGKRGGAFMSSTVGQPIFVFLNHTNTFKSLETLAHEMGHALHTMRSKTQTPLYESYSTTTAETASTLFENIVFNHVLAQCNKEDKLLLLHDRITRDIATIQRQIAFFNFEYDMHTTIRMQGAMTSEELQKMMQKHLSAYLGPAVEVTERDGLSYIYVSHFRYGFYVYTYTYGILMSTIMAGNLKADPSYVKEIDIFLTAGGSDTVENIFRKIGIDPLKRATFEKSLALLENDIAEFEKLTAASKKKR